MRSLVAAALFLVAANALSLTAQQPTPEATVRELVRVMNAGDRAALRSFVEQRFVNDGPNAVPAGERVNRLANVHDRFGDLAIRTVDATRAAEPSALVQSGRLESWARLTVFFDGGTPPRISRIGLAPAPSPDAPTRRLTDAEVVEQLKAYVERMASRDVFSGTVLLAKAGKPLYRAAFGEANKDFGVKNTIDTKFNRPSR